MGKRRGWLGLPFVGENVGYPAVESHLDTA